MNEKYKIKYNYIVLDGIKYCCLDNPNHSSCFFTATIQLLHSSKTLTNLITSQRYKQYLLDNFKTLFRVLIYYGEFNENIKETDNYAYINMLNEYLTEDMSNIIKTGYNWITMLNSYYFPIIYYKLCDDDKTNFYKILFEISLEPQLLVRTSANVLDIVNANEKNLLLPLLDNYMNNLDTIKYTYTKLLEEQEYSDFAYRVIMLEMYNNGLSTGHVVAMLSTLYDQNNGDIRGGNISVNNNSFFILDKHDIKNFIDYFVGSGNQIKADTLRINYVDNNRVIYNSLYKYISSFNKYLDKNNNDINNVDSYYRFNGGTKPGVNEKMYSININNFDKFIENFNIERYIDESDTKLDNIDIQELEKHYIITKPLDHYKLIYLLETNNMNNTNTSMNGGYPPNENTDTNTNDVNNDISIDDTNINDIITNDVINDNINNNPINTNNVNNITRNTNANTRNVNKSSSRSDDRDDPGIGAIFGGIIFGALVIGCIACIVKLIEFGIKEITKKIKKEKYSKAKHGKPKCKHNCKSRCNKRYNT